jgi:hypothetical protein
MQRVEQLDPVDSVTAGRRQIMKRLMKVVLGLALATSLIRCGVDSEESGGEVVGESSSALRSAGGDGVAAPSTDTSAEKKKDGGTGQQDYLIIKINDVLISGVQ